MELLPELVRAIILMHAAMATIVSQAPRITDENFILLASQ
jgi:hypothetical protein